MSRLTSFLLGWLVWTVLALLSASQFAVSLALGDQPFAWGTLVPRSLINWYSCAIFTPFFFVAARRWPIRETGWWRVLPVHLLLCAVASALKFAIELEALRLLMDDTRRSFGMLMQRGFISENIAFWCLAGVVHAIEFQRAVRERERVAARLQARLSEAQLEALAARLQPHFLFNTLQAISTLVHRDPASADRMLGHLGTMLRGLLATDGSHEVSLSTELGLLDDYLAIARVRFGDRLVITVSVPDELRGALVPRFVLQPLLENAFDHGIARRAGPATVTVGATREGSDLLLVVADDGAGPAAGAREGIGMGNTRRRLAELYGPAADLTVAARADAGTSVTVRIPHHLEPVTPRGAAA